MKIGIVGAGHVGATAAHSLVMQGVGSEIVLVDRNRALADAQAMDVLHATPFSHPLRLRSGDYEALEGAAVVIIAAGVSQLAGESRLALLSRNVAVFADIVPLVLRHAGNAVIVVATNPLDIMTYAAARISGLPAERVLGTGTMLDTARFRALIAGRFAVSPSSVHAHVLGEHGDSEVLAWSAARVGGLPLHQLAAASGAPLDPATIADIEDGVRGAAQRIIAGKGATYYGIGAALARLTRAILHDEHAVLTVSSVVDDIEGVRDVALSLPCTVGANGIAMRLPVGLNAQETDALRSSARMIRQHIASLGY
ncbi:L-lactate dehydrogenase [Noviherbaspirillum galbum]|uniref:L-lactate dehydrogenase n=1 Tax=Noviherbaspirillum galbum TaxID=2709383 RepID=A0A6B3SSM5_9BURK|nr:L-lactate dehydrogenase [Noviherbaspirillum galbum]NEX62355.1 L-lactate dehydrogenase [Noviherbaspirillum galbum]